MKRRKRRVTSAALLARLQRAAALELQHMERAASAYDRGRVRVMRKEMALANRATRAMERVRAVLYVRGQRQQARLLRVARLPVDRGNSSQEWEFGFQFTGTRGIKRGRERGHSVDVNFHIRRSDGKAMGTTEARAAMGVTITAEGHAPKGYEIAAVDWRNPKKSHGWKSGSLRMALNSDLVNVIGQMAQRPGAWRMGNPKWEDV